MSLSYEQQQDHFISSAVTYMNTHHNIQLSHAKQLMEKYIYDIVVTSPVVQQLGTDYFALQILMAEGIIPYQPI